MLNNILNGWRTLITKLAIASLLLYLIIKCIPVLAAVTVDSKWTCSESKEIVDVLVSSGEEIIATGAVDEILVMTFWTNRSTKDWTLVLTSDKTREISCIVIYGNKLKTIPSTRMSI